MAKPIETNPNSIVAEGTMEKVQRNINNAYPVVDVQLETKVQKDIQNGLEGSAKVVLVEANSTNL